MSHYLNMQICVNQGSSPQDLTACPLGCLTDFSEILLKKKCLQEQTLGYAV